MSSAREQLLGILAAQSFRLGDFQLSSGGRSDYYVDCRTTTLDALGADPMVAAVAMLSAQEGQSRAEAGEERRRAFVHGFLVRKAEKAHGTGQRIEGFQKKGARVVIVDDVCTTGASTVQAIEAAREAGFNIIGVLCLVEREEAGGRAAVEKAASTAPFLAIFRAAEVRHAHLRLKQEAAAAP